MSSTRHPFSPSLVKLGLTKSQALAYQTLCSNGPLTAIQLAHKLHIHPNASYRLAQKLQKLNLITIRNTHPQVFTAIDPTLGLNSLVQSKKSQLAALQTQVLNELTYTSPTSTTKLSLLNHKNLFFSAYVKYAKQAKKEICIISIGESVTDEILLANRDAIEKGVVIKMLSQTLNQHNQQLLQNHIHMGLQVRYHPESGYHLATFDGKQTLLAISNPNQTDDRLGLAINSPGFSQAMQRYFNSLWQIAQPIDLL